MRTMKYFIFLTFLNVFFVHIFSQTPIIPEKKVYESVDEKIYINKKLPLYLSISTSPHADSTQYLLKSRVTTKYSNPMYLDTEGINTFKSPSAVDPVTKKTVWPIRDVVFEVYADGWTPETKISFEKTNKTYVNGVYVCNGNTKITLNAWDYMSGVAKIYYSLDKSDFIEYNSTIKLKQGKHNLQYYSVDNVGNMELIKSCNIEVKN